MHAGFVIDWKLSIRIWSRSGGRSLQSCKGGVSTKYLYFYLEVITWLFSHWPIYQVRASITTRGLAKGSCRLKARYRANIYMYVFIHQIYWHWYENSRVITSLSYWRTSQLPYFICHNSLLEYAESNWWMIDRLLRCIHSAGPSTSCNNQRRSLLWYMDIRNKATLSVEARALMSAPGIFIYNRPLLIITARC